MSISYTGVSWNRQKRIYDLTLFGLLAVCLAMFIGVTLWFSPASTIETLIIRSTAVAGFLLLHVILCVGPLARLDRRFLPLLYNRRHLGVSMFLLALIHAVFATVQFHALGDVNPLVSVFTAYSRDYGWTPHLPFEPFGALALVILFLMAATSHDFWLKNLGATFWKCLHLLVFVAYGALIVHVAFGVLQHERSIAYPILVAFGLAAVLGLHYAAARKEAAVDRGPQGLSVDSWIPVCRALDVKEGRGKVVMVNGARVALFRHQDRIYATSNVCRHQGGPLGEGRVIDGCITCPWHGWQYRPEDGCSPPPFQEIIPTHATRIVAGVVQVNPTPQPLRTRNTGALASTIAQSKPAAAAGPLHGGCCAGEATEAERAVVPEAISHE